MAVSLTALTTLRYFRPFLYSIFSWVIK